MTQRLRALLRARTERMTAARALLDAAGTATLSDDQRSQVDAIHAEVERIDQDIEREERSVALSAARSGEAGRASDEDVEDDVDDTAIDPESPAGRRDRARRDRQNTQFRNFLRGRAVEGRYRSDVLADERDVATSRGVDLGAAGGFLIPPEVQGLFEVPQYRSRIAQLVTTFSTDSGAKWPMPVYDAAPKGRRVKSGKSVGTGKKFGGIKTREWDAFLYNSGATEEEGVILLDNDQIADTGFDLLGFVQMQIDERIDRALFEDVLFNEEPNGPQGIFHTAGVGRITPTGQVSDVTWLDLVKCKMAVAPEFREQGGTWAIGSDLLSLLWGKVDGNGKPLLTGDGREGVFNRLTGDPLVEFAEIPAVAAGAKVAAHGLFKEYWLRNVAGTKVTILREMFASSNQVGILGFRRHDGYLRTPRAIKLLQMASS